MTKGKGRNPGAGGLDKHIKRREHKERSQPKARQHLGQLEKHKDHVLRAKKRKTKVKRLQDIKRAAAQRNPDEFNIGMTKAVMDVATGKMKARKVRLLEGEKKKQLLKAMEHNRTNVQYLEFKANADMQRARELLDEEASAALTSTAPRNKHIVFVDTADEVKRFDSVKELGATREMLLQHPAVRGRISVLEKTVLPDEVLMSGGHQMKSTAQRRRERQEVQEKLRRAGAESAEARAAFVEKLRAKKELKQYRFASFEDLPPPASASAAQGGDEENHGEEEEEMDEVQRLLKWRREKEHEEAVKAARRVREVSQRVQRSKNLMALSRNVKKQTEGIKRQMNQRRESRFKNNAPRRAR